MMTSPTGKPAAAVAEARSCLGTSRGSRRPLKAFPLRGLGTRPAAGFTLIELILVLAVLAIVLGVAAPSLARFFHGRKVEEEARRFLALTRYGQSRAVAEGMPMILWMDPENRRYGLEAEVTFGEPDPQARVYEMDQSLRLEVDLPQTTGIGLDGILTARRPDRRLVIRFTPEGFPGLESPERIRFVQETDTDETVAVVRLTRNRLAYEMETYEVPASAR